MRRIYQAGDLSVGQTVELNEAASHHLARVLRVSVGETVAIFNGQGGEYRGQIVSVSKKVVSVRLEEYVAQTNESPIKLCLVQGLVSGEKMDFIVQKAVELGVFAIQPLFTEYANVRLNAERLEKRMRHWQAVAVSACEQSGRTIVPTVYAPVSLEAWLDTQQDTKLYLLTPHHQQVDLKEQKVDEAQINLMIGPEGGFSQAEAELAFSRGAQALNLGPRILRTETASVSAISLLQYLFGDLQKH